MRVWRSWRQRRLRIFYEALAHLATTSDHGSTFAHWRLRGEQPDESDSRLNSEPCGTFRLLLVLSCVGSFVAQGVSGPSTRNLLAIAASSDLSKSSLTSEARVSASVTRERERHVRTSWS